MERLKQVWDRMKAEGHTHSMDHRWQTFDGFMQWVMQQNPPSMILDTELIRDGRKHYGPETCVFIWRDVYELLYDLDHTGRPLPADVWEIKNRPGTFVAMCRHPGSDRRKLVGKFKTYQEAYDARQAVKHKFACHVAAAQRDHRIAQALRTYFV